MKLSDIRCERLREKDSLTATKLLSLDADTGHDLLQVLEEEPEVFIAAYVQETLIALVQMEASALQSHLNVFVAPQYHAARHWQGFDAGGRSSTTGRRNP